MKNYYKILQVDPSAQPAIIKAAYRTLMLSLQNHPDYGGDPSAAKAINEAYEILKDPIKRLEYDKHNYYKMKESPDKPQEYYIRCYFCETINKIELNIASIKTVKCGKCKSPLFSLNSDLSTARTTKRNATRYKCNFSLKFQLKNDTAIYTAKCLDISTKGIRMQTSVQLKNDDIIRIGFNHNKYFQALAKIIRVKKIINADNTLFECAGMYIEVNYDKPDLAANFKNSL